MLNLTFSLPGIKIFFVNTTFFSKFLNGIVSFGYDSDIPSDGFGCDRMVTSDLKSQKQKTRDEINFS